MHRYVNRNTVPLTPLGWMGGERGGSSQHPCHRLLLLLNEPPGQGCHGGHRLGEGRREGGGEATPSVRDASHPACCFLTGPI